jgi:hypothetical protein
MSTSNLGTDTTTLFQLVAEAAKATTQPQAQSPAVLHVWRTVFKYSVSQNEELLRSLAVVISRLALIDEKISHSKMDDHQKRIAHDIIDGLTSLTRPDLFARSIGDLLPSIHPDKIAILGMFSLALENSEPTLSADDAKQIAEDIDKLGLFISNANIEPDLKKLLLHHVSYMGWAVQNINIVGAQGVYEAFGPAVLTARQFVESEDPDNPGEATTKSIYDRLLDIARKTIRFLQFTDKTIELLNHVDDDIQGLLP